MIPRTVTGTLPTYPRATVRFRQLQTFIVAEATYLSTEYSVAADTDGDFSIALPVPDTGTVAYLIELPDGTAAGVYLGAGVATTLEILLAGAFASGVAQSVVQAAVDAEAALRAAADAAEAAARIAADLLKAPLASPTFTGTPAAPTAAVGTNTTQLATTAFATAADTTLQSTINSMQLARLKALAVGGYLWDGLSAFTGVSGAIASWVPAVGALAAAQATGANQPIVGTLNSKPAAVFDGTNDVLQTTTFGASFTTPYTILCVYQRTGAVGGVTRAIHDGILTTNRAALLHQGSDDGIRIRGSTQGLAGFASSLNPTVARSVFNGASSFLYINGVPTTVIDTGTAVLTGVTLGAVFNGTSNQFPGAIAAYMLIPNAADGDVRVIEAEALLQARYGF